MQTSPPVSVPWTTAVFAWDASFRFECLDDALHSRLSFEAWCADDPLRVLGWDGPLGTAHWALEPSGPAATSGHLRMDGESDPLRAALAAGERVGVTLQLTDAVLHAAAGRLNVSLSWDFEHVDGRPFLAAPSSSSMSHADERPLPPPALLPPPGTPQPKMIQAAAAGRAARCSATLHVDPVRAPSPLSGAVDPDHKSTTPLGSSPRRSRSAGNLLVHVAGASGLPTRDSAPRTTSTSAPRTTSTSSHLSAMATFLVKVRLGDVVVHAPLIRAAARPQFGWDVRTPAQHLLLATTGSLEIEISDGDTFFAGGEYELIGRVTLSLAAHRRALAAGERVRCALPLSRSQQPEQRQQKRPEHHQEQLEEQHEERRWRRERERLTMQQRRDEGYQELEDSQNAEGQEEEEDKEELESAHVDKGAGAKVGKGMANVALLHVELEWIASDATRSFPPQEDAEWRESIPSPPPPPKPELPLEMTAEPAPLLMLLLFFGLPIVMGGLAWDAQYSTLALATATAMPIVTMTAYLVTPITPPEDPTEPPFPTLETVLPRPVYAVLSVPIELATKAKACVVEQTLGRLSSLVGPLLAPHMATLAFGIQIYMGLSSLVEAEDGLVHVHRVSAGIVILIMTAVQVPDSMAWAFTSFPPLQRCVDAFNGRKAIVEGSVVNAADDFMRQAQEIAESSKDQYPAFAEGMLTPPVAVKPFIRAGCEWLDEIGSVARASPLKSIVLILELMLAVDGIVLPSLPGLPSWDQLSGMAIWLDKSLRAPPTAFASVVVGDDGKLRNVSMGCGAGEPCQALGPLQRAASDGPPYGSAQDTAYKRPYGDRASCNSSHAWFPRSSSEANSGIVVLFEPKHIAASSLVVYYQLDSRAASESVMAFSMRFELNDEQSSWDRASRDALKHWEHKQDAVAANGNDGEEDWGEAESRRLLRTRSPLSRRRRKGDSAAAANATDYDARVVVVDVLSFRDGRRNVSFFELASITDPLPVPFRAFEESLGHPDTSPTSLVAPKAMQNALLCAPPLHLQLESVNGTHPRLRAVHVSLHSATGHHTSVGLDAIELVESREEAEEFIMEGVEAEVEERGGEDGGDGPVSSEEPVSSAGAGAGGGSSSDSAELPIGEIATVTGVAATAAASSDFVRSHVKPNEYAKGKAKEAAKKQAQVARSGAEGRVRKLLATPVLEVDVAEGLSIIEEAEAENVLASLIDKAAQHVEKAAQAQFAVA